MNSDVLDEKISVIEDQQRDDDDLDDGWKILIVDDERDVHIATRLAMDSVRFEGRTFEFISAYTGAEARNFLERQSDIAVILLDVVMEEPNTGLNIIRYLREELNNHLTRVILRTGHPGQAPEEKVIIDYDINDYKTKTELTKKKLFTSLVSALRAYGLLRRIDADRNDAVAENRALKRRILSDGLDFPEAFASIITTDTAMRSIFRYIEALGRSNRPVLITGETGVGKELIAKAIHQISGLRGRVITVNIGGLDDNLFSDTLFGHVKGAFTGARDKRHGLIEQAAGGTLFLDEIGDLQAPSQVKLLRLLQEKEYYPLGSDIRKTSDARVILATNRNLVELMQSGSFREDLYYRLNTHEIHIPPLRRRKGDIPRLLRHFANRAAHELGIPQLEISDAICEFVTAYDFPGNVRELESMTFDGVNRTLSGHSLEDFFLDKLANKLGTASRQKFGSTHTTSLAIEHSGPFPALKSVIDQTIDKALDAAGGKQAEAAKLLGLSRQALNQRLMRRRK